MRPVLRQRGCSERPGAKCKLRIRRERERNSDQDREAGANHPLDSANRAIKQTLRGVSVVIIDALRARGIAVGVGLALCSALLVGTAANHGVINVEAAASAGWTTYHRDNSRNGYDPAAPTFPATGPPSTKWSTSLDGALYASPLVYSGVVYQATENNSVYALDEITGVQIWRWHQYASRPNPAAAVGCGNIDPVGITGTPVIDPAAGIIYAVGLVATSTGGGSKYQIFALNLSNGAMLTGFPRDIAQPNPVYQQERSALALAPNGLMVYVAFGGWAGDCTPYHPFVIGVPVGANLGQAQLVYQPQTSQQNGGGIWAPS